MLLVGLFSCSAILGCLEDFGEYDFVPDAGSAATTQAGSTAARSTASQSTTTQSAGPQSDGSDSTEEESTVSDSRSDDASSGAINNDIPLGVTAEPGSPE